MGKYAILPSGIAVPAGFVLRQRPQAIVPASRVERRHPATEKEVAANLLRQLTKGVSHGK